MAKGTSTPTRVHADIAATAAAVARSENRTITEQINHWARIGMQIERSTSLGYRKVLAAATGEAQFSTLNDEERAAAHALVDARIAERVAQASFGDDAVRGGHSCVSLDDDGNLVMYHPDGTEERL